jgi:N-acetylmuramoyl-L-alanine amidase CwlA
MEINKKQIAYNRAARTQKPLYIVIHDTGNGAKGADAGAHFTYFNGGNRDASADFFVDSTQILQVNDYEKYYSWHCGDGKGAYGITNANSVGVEICVNADGDYNAAVANAAALTRFLTGALGVPAERIVRHWDASRKNCPASMRADDWAKWNEFKAALAAPAELTTPNDIVWELAHRGILSDKALWLKKLDADSDAYWLARKTVKYLREKGA